METRLQTVLLSLWTKKQHIKNNDSPLYIPVEQSNVKHYSYTAIMLYESIKIYC